jgi:hypothetical protein
MSEKVWLLLGEKLIRVGTGGQREPVFGLFWKPVRVRGDRRQVRGKIMSTICGAACDESSGWVF